MDADEFTAGTPPKPARAASTPNDKAAPDEDEDQQVCQLADVFRFIREQGLSDQERARRVARTRGKDVSALVTIEKVWRDEQGCRVWGRMEAATVLFFFTPDRANDSRAINQGDECVFEGRLYGLTPDGATVTPCLLVTRKAKK